MANKQGDTTPEEECKIHRKKVKRTINVLLRALQDRAEKHDMTKFEEPEKSCYDKYVPLLRETEYGTKEYWEVKEKMGKGLEHHYKNNPHHPEYYEDGIDGMSLVDVVEMFCDWYAASQRSDTGFLEGLKKNKKHNKMSEQLVHIFENTFEDFFNEEKKD